MVTVEIPLIKWSMAVFPWKRVRIISVFYHPRTIGIVVVTTGKLMGQTVVKLHHNIVLKIAEILVFEKNAAYSASQLRSVAYFPICIFYFKKCWIFSFALYYSANEYSVSIHTWLSKRNSGRTSFVGVTAGWRILHCWLGSINRWKRTLTVNALNIDCQKQYDAFECFTILFPRKKKNRKNICGSNEFESWS